MKNLKVQNQECEKSEKYEEMDNHFNVVVFRHRQCP